MALKADRSAALVAVLVFGLSGASARAGDEGMQKLGLKHTDSYRIADDDDAADAPAAAESAATKPQVEMTEPDTRAAVLELQRELEKARSQESASDSVSDPE
jgi:hypothetical protein